MSIKKEDVEYVAKLARLKLTEEEKQLYTKQLQHILNYMSVLNKVDTTNISPTFSVIEREGFLREDIVKESLPIEDVLRNAPEKYKDFFKVKKVIDI